MEPYSQLAVNALIPLKDAKTGMTYCGPIFLYTKLLRRTRVYVQ